MKNPRPIIFLASIGLVIAKKVEKKIGKVLKKPVFFFKFPIQKGHYAEKYAFRSQLGGRRVKAPGELFKFRKKFLNPCIPNFNIPKNEEKKVLIPLSP